MIYIRGRMHGRKKDYMSDYVLFYRDERLTIAGHSFSDILAFSDDQLEREHMYIQWLFPNRKLSQMQPGAATEPFTDEAAEEMLDDDIVVARIGLAVQMMLRFWGIQWNGNTVRVVDKERFAAKLGRVNHNQLRMTRMLEFLRCLEWSALIDDIRAELQANIAGQKRAMGFWMAV